MFYTVLKDLGYGYYLGVAQHSGETKFIVIQSEIELFIEVETFEYDPKEDKIIWEGVEHLEQKVIGFASNESDALNLAF